MTIRTTLARNRVAEIELGNGRVIDIDPAKPFAVVIPANSGRLTLFDDLGNVVGVNTYEPTI